MANEIVGSGRGSQRKAREQHDRGCIPSDTKRHGDNPMSATFPHKSRRILRVPQRVCHPVEHEDSRSVWLSGTDLAIG